MTVALTPTVKLAGGVPDFFASQVLPANRFQPVEDVGSKSYDSGSRKRKRIEAIEELST